MSEKKFSFTEALFVLPGSVIAFLGVYIIFLPIGLLVAYIRTKLWDWFVVPYFHLPHVSVWVMFGISILLATFNYVDNNKKNEDNKQNFINALLWYVLQLVALGIGYVIHHWIVR